MTVILIIQITLTLCIMTLMLIGIIEVISYDVIEQEFSNIRDELEAVEE